MPVTIPAEQGIPIAHLRWKAYVFPQFGIPNLLLAVCAVTVLLIGAYASFAGQSPFPGDFDVSIAPF
jgi:hypothetical protein